jgi:hypothetical protein
MNASRPAKKTPLMCLCLKKADGQKPDACMMKWENGALLGEYTTRNFGESPSVAVESRLSAILEESVPEKYFLSRKAKDGVLRRMKSGGLEIPEELADALR